MLYVQKLPPLMVRQPAADGPFQRFEVQTRLLGKPRIKECADLEILLQPGCDVLRRAALGERFEHQAIELGVLRLLDPVMLEQTLKLWIEILVVLDTPQVVSLRHPLEAEDCDGNREGMVAQDRPADLVGRTDETAWRTESAVKLAQHRTKQLAMLLFFIDKVAQRRCAKRIRLYFIIRLTRNERHDKGFDQFEQREVAARPDVVQLEFLRSAQESERLGLRKRLGEKRPREIQSPPLPNEILYAPVHAPRGLKQVLIIR